ncbi:MAG: M42 family metallopeptidase [Candidatus Omnitrophota bacterium]
MDELLRKLLNASGVSGHESEIAGIMQQELKNSCDEASIDNFGNVIARKGSGGKKIMLAAHMDEVGLMVKHISKDGYINFIKVGGVDDRILPGQRVVVKAKKGDVLGIIGSKPPHLQKEEEKKHPIKYEDMFIDIGCKNKEEALEKVSLGDSMIFEPNCGELSSKLCYGKAVDNRLGCFILLKVMERLKVNAEVYAVATAQEEVGLKGARTSSFKVNPDFAIAIDTTMAGDTPGIKESETPLKLGEGPAIIMIEASGRGFIISEKTKDIFIETAKEHKIKHQVAVIEGGMTDGAMIYMNREGVPTGVLSVPTRYVHAPTGVFSLDDINSAIDLTVKVVEKVAKI